MMNKVAIVVEADGEVVTPRLDRLAEPDHPGGPLVSIRSLIDSTDPHGTDIPELDGLVA